jgi:phosphoglycolate phosphatase
VKIENVEGVIWDLDGTILDSFGVFEEVIQEIATERGLSSPTRDHILLNYHGSLEESISGVLGIEAEKLTPFVQSFLEKQNGHYGENTEASLFVDAIDIAQSAAKRGIPQLLITNRAHEGRGDASPKAIVAATVLAECIDEIRCGDEVAYRKPDKRVARDWLESRGLQAANIIVIGDQSVDAKLAQNLGARAVLVARNGNIPHLNGTYSDRITIVNSLHEIKIS